MLRCITPSHHISPPCRLLFRALFLADPSFGSLLDLSLLLEGTPDEHPERRLRLTGGCKEGEGERQGIDKSGDGRRQSVPSVISTSSSPFNGEHGNGMKLRTSGSSGSLAPKPNPWFCKHTAENDIETVGEAL